MAILDTVKGWTIEEGDFVVIDGDSVQVLTIVDMGDTIEVEAIGVDREPYTIYPHKDYEIWGE